MSQYEDLFKDIGNDPDISEVVKQKVRDDKTKAQQRARIKILQQELENERRAREVLLNIKTEPPKINFRIPKPKRKSRKNTAVTGSMFSDIHCDEIIEPHEVNGRNEHTPEICEQKFKRYCEGVVALVEKEQTFYNIDTHIFWIGGDLLTGHIHDELVEVTAMAPPETIVWLYPRLKAIIQYLAENLKVKRLIIPWSFGNHGRDGKKPRISKAAVHNFEFILAKLLEEEIKKEPWGKKVHMIIEPSYLNYVDLECSNGKIFKIACHHGDGLSGGGGAGGLAGPVTRAINGWNKHIYADLYIGGHYHQIVEGRNFYQNGSLIGHSPYAIKIRAAPEPPQQGFFVIDTDRAQKVSSSIIHVLPKEDLERFGWI